MSIPTRHPHEEVVDITVYSFLLNSIIPAIPTPANACLRFDVDKWSDILNDYTTEIHTHHMELQPSKRCTANSV